MLARTFLCIAILGATSALAANDFLLGPDYSEWLYASANNEQIATDGSGNLYLFTIYPGTSNASPLVFQVTKVSADGATIVWQNAVGFPIGSIAVDPLGGVYVLSSEQSATIGGPPPTTRMVAKLGANGKGIAWPVQLGFIQAAYATVLAVDSRRCYVAGAHDAVNGVGGVVRLSADGSGIDYASTLKGLPTAIAVSTSGNAFVAGSGFVASLAPDGSAGFYATIPATGDPAALAVDPDGRVVLNSSGMLRRFDSAGNITLSKAILNSLAPTVAVDAGGNIYVTGYSNQLPPVRNSLATCGSDFLGVLAPDGSVLQTTYIPGGVGSYAFIALGSNSTVFVMDSANSGFVPSRNGPFSSGPAANSTQVTAFLWHLSPHPDAQTYPLACLGNSASYISAGFPISPGTMVTLTGNGLGPIDSDKRDAAIAFPDAGRECASHFRRKACSACVGAGCAD